MFKKKAPLPLGEEDGPFSYVYIAVMEIPGALLSQSIDEELDIWNFSNLNSRAFLTRNWDKYCYHMDRSAAISHLLFTAFVSHGRFRRLRNKVEAIVFGKEKTSLRNLDRQCNVEKDRRHKEKVSTSCFLVYTASGEPLGQPNFQFARRIGDVGYGLGMLDSSIYTAYHRNALHATATAISLTLSRTTSSSEIHFFRDVVYLVSEDGLAAYSTNPQLGSPNIYMSSTLSQDTIENFKKYIPLMNQDSRTTSAIDLFIQSQIRENDNLRAFIAAWSALELLINRFSRLFRDEWNTLLQEGAIPDWDTDLSNVPVGNYRMKDRFFAVACVLDYSSALDDCSIFNDANNVRNDFYHRLGIGEEQLPTSDVKFLFRKYLRLALISSNSVKGRS